MSFALLRKTGRRGEGVTISQWHATSFTDRDREGALSPYEILLALQALPLDVERRSGLRVLVKRRELGVESLPLAFFGPHLELERPLLLVELGVGNDSLEVGESSCRLLDLLLCEVDLRLDGSDRIFLALVSVTPDELLNLRLRSGMT